MASMTLQYPLANLVSGLFCLFFLDFLYTTEGNPLDTNIYISLVCVNPFHEFFHLIIIYCISFFFFTCLSSRFSLAASTCRGSFDFELLRRRDEPQNRSRRNDFIAFDQTPVGARGRLD